MHRSAQSIQLLCKLLHSIFSPGSVLPKILSHQLPSVVEQLVCVIPEPNDLSAIFALKLKEPLVS